jgi:hypothetical protein
LTAVDAIAKETAVMALTCLLHRLLDALFLRQDPDRCQAADAQARISLKLICP